MLAGIIKYSVISLCAMFVYICAFSNIYSKKVYFVGFPLAILSGLVTGMIRSYVYPFHIFIMIILFNMILSPYLKIHLTQSIYASIVSFGVSYAAFMLVCALPTYIIVLLFPSATESIKLLLLLLVGIAQLIVIKILFSSQRIKSGFHYIAKPDSYNIGLTISVSILTLISMLSIAGEANIIYCIPIFTLMFISLLLLIWRRTQITRTYHTRVQEIQIKSLEDALEQNMETTKALRDDNTNLSSIIHKDNKLIPAMKIAIEKSMIEYSDGEEIKIATDVIRSLHHMMQERTEAVQQYEKRSLGIKESGNIIIDAMLLYMDKRAKDNGISFTVQNTISDVSNIVRNHISSEHLNTILADLIENALIAVMHADGAHNILIDVRKHDNVYSVDIYDDGIPFEYNILQLLGYRRVTSHKDTGGSGIGMMSTFELLSYSRASFEITEYSGMEYAKRVSVCFDGLSQYRIISPRESSLKRYVTRPDVIIQSGIK